VNTNSGGFRISPPGTGLFSFMPFYYIFISYEYLFIGRLFVSWRSAPFHFASADTVMHIVSSSKDVKNHTFSLQNINIHGIIIQ
jgi:hypothetical protein